MTPPEHAKNLIVISALFYALFPVMAMAGGGHILPGFVVLFAITQGILFLPLLINARVQQAFKLTLQEPKLALHLFLNATFFLLAAVSIVKAMSSGHAGLALVLFEFWPIMGTLVIASLLKKGTDAIKGMGAIQGVLATLGMLIAAEAWKGGGHLNSEIVFWGLMAGIGLGGAVAMKLKVMNTLERHMPILPYESLSVLMIAFLPVGLLAFIAGIVAPEGYGSVFQTHDMTPLHNLVIIMALINAFSSIVFALGIQSMKNINDSLYWLLTPVFSLCLLMFLGQIPFSIYDFIGLMLVIAAGLTPWATAVKVQNLGHAAPTAIFTTEEDDVATL